MLERLAAACHRRHRTVISIWILAVLLAIGASAVWSGDPSSSGRLPGTDSDAAYQLLSREFPDAAGETGAVVVHADSAAALSAARSAIEATLQRASQLPDVASVGSPWADGQLSADGTTAIASIRFVDADFDQVGAAADALERDVSKSLTETGVETSFSGAVFRDVEVPASEAFGFLAAAVILLLAFGSVVAMGLPLATAIAGIVIGLTGVTLWSYAVNTPDFTPQVASMVGIGVGIDYALFIVTRCRTELTNGRSPRDAVIAAVGSAGRAVVFAGGTVIVSLMGMFFIGLPFLYGLAVGTASAVLVAVLAAVTLLPALLAVVGGRLDRWSIHRRRAHRTGETMWHRWSRLVQRRAAASALLGLGALLVLGAPVLTLHLASADEGTDPVGSTTRTAYDHVSEAFGAGANGPLVIVAEVPDDGARAAFADLREAVAATPGVASTGPVVPSADGTAALIQVVPTTSPQSRATASLVGHLRHDMVAPTGLEAHIGGATASDVDFSALMGDRLPVFIGAVLVLSFLLLMVVFRSVLVPLKAVLVNLLSIGAAYGVIVAVFQWGWFGSLFGITGGAPIEPWVPMILFAIVFGLSMDYEVFLLSAIKEHHDATGDDSAAVVEGLSSTARVITAAAAIMVCVFGSFVVGDARSIKLVGLGLAAAVLIDATIVRMVLVPATMQLLGAKNWWLPRWLDRVLPQVSVESAHHRPIDHEGLEPRPLESAGAGR